MADGRAPPRGLTSLSSVLAWLAIQDRGPCRRYCSKVVVVAFAPDEDGPTRRIRAVPVACQGDAPSTGCGDPSSPMPARAAPSCPKKPQVPGGLPCDCSPPGLDRCGLETKRVLA